jgi:2,4-dienoyl-CoA reductase-like NADH-dependent reductase (Old Yellow Enzyme family)/thioredoxin reductase
MSHVYRHLLAPGRIGRLELRNRILMSPMGSNLAEEDGSCGERIARYYEARAKGGAALVTMGSVGVAWPRGSGNARQVAISEDRFIAPLAKVADAVHAHGCRIALQLQHAGAIAVNEPFRGFPFLVPSVPPQKPPDWPADLSPQEHKEMFEAIFAPGITFEFKEADEADLAWLVDSFAKAAVRAREAGIDAVEIHAGHGYLLSAFLSPASNRRSDRYGGSLENRARLLVEVIHAIKRAAGADYPVWFRLDSQEYLKHDGITVEDAIATAKLGVEAGADAVHVSAYADASRGISFTEAHTVHEPCRYVPAAAAIKSAIAAPVISVGRIEPEIADRLIADGKLDFVAMARKLLADPELPRKLQSGSADRVRPCIYCYTCISQIFFGRNVRCAVNPQTAYEADEPIVPLGAGEKPRRVLVVGGGPAGLEAARVARLRGHDVELHEARGRLGGTVFFSSIVYPENGRLIDYLAREVAALGVRVHLNSTVTRESVRKLAPDVVIVATGATRGRTELPGADLPHVFGGDEMREMVAGRIDGELARKLSAHTKLMLRAGSALHLLDKSATIRRLSEHYLPLGRHVAIYGGGLVGVELAEFLAERHRVVTLIEPGTTFGKELMIVRRWRIMDTLRRLGVTLLANTELLSISRSAVTYRTQHGQEQRRRADHVIMALGATPDDALMRELEGVGPRIHCVGDAEALGYIEGAVRSGNRVARAI